MNNYVIGICGVQKYRDMEVFAYGITKTLEIVEREDRDITIAVRNDTREDYLVTSFAIARKRRIRLLDSDDFIDHLDAVIFCFQKIEEKKKIEYRRIRSQARKKGILFLPVWLNKKKLVEKKKIIGKATLDSLLYVPDHLVEPEMLYAFEYQAPVPEGQDVEIEPETYQAYKEIKQKGMYAFQRGDIKKIHDLFGDLGITDNRNKSPFSRRWRFKFPKGGGYREGQKEAIKEYMGKKFQGDYVGGQLIGPPRSGKTVVGTEILTKLGQKILLTASLKEAVISFYEAFLKFTNIKKDRIKLVMDNDSLDDVDMRKLDIICVTYQKLYQTKGYKWLRKNNQYIGCVAVDECDQVPADVYASVISHLNPLYRYGTTATHERVDLKHFVSDDILGPINTIMEAKEVDLCYRIMQSKMNPGKWQQRTAYIRRISRNQDRNIMIADLAKKKYDQGRYVIISVELTGKINHPKLLKRELRLAGIPNKDIMVVTGKTADRRTVKKDVEGCKYRVMVFQKKIIQRVWTIEYARTLIMTTPVGNKPNLRQLTARVRNFTEHPKYSKQEAEVILIGDDSNACYGIGSRFKSLMATIKGAYYFYDKHGRDNREGKYTEDKYIPETKRANFITDCFNF